MDLKRVVGFHLYNGTAVGSYTGTIDFILDKGEGEGGSTTMRDSHSAGRVNRTIPIISVVDLFTVHKICKEDFVVMKVDIEGAEFDVLKHMLSHELIPRIDILAVEYHDTNPWVLGGVTKYAQQHQCIDWILPSFNNLLITDWARR